MKKSRISRLLRRLDRNKRKKLDLSFLGEPMVERSSILRYNVGDKVWITGLARARLGIECYVGFNIVKVDPDNDKYPYTIQVTGESFRDIGYWEIASAQIGGSFRASGFVRDTSKDVTQPVNKDFLKAFGDLVI